MPVRLQDEEEVQAQQHIPTRGNTEAVEELIQPSQSQHYESTPFLITGLVTIALGLPFISLLGSLCSTLAPQGHAERYFFLIMSIGVVINPHHHIVRRYGIGGFIGFWATTWLALPILLGQVLPQATVTLIVAGITTTAIYQSALLPFYVWLNQLMGRLSRQDLGGLLVTLGVVAIAYPVLVGSLQVLHAIFAIVMLMTAVMQWILPLTMRVMYRYEPGRALLQVTTPLIVVIGSIAWWLYGAIAIAPYLLTLFLVPLGCWLIAMGPSKKGTPTK